MKKAQQIAEEIIEMFAGMTAADHAEVGMVLKNFLMRLDVTSLLEIKLFLTERITVYGEQRRLYE
jgi:hypothetical protein